MKLSRYEILSSSILAFEISFKCNKKQITHFKEYEPIEKDGSWLVRTPFKSYYESKIELGKIISLMNSYTNTEWNDNLLVHISFPEDISKIYHINALKLIISFEEEYLYNLFPDKKNRVGSRTVTNLIKPGVIKDGVSNALENESNIYGISLSKKGNNEICYRYIGGKDYHTKYQEISAIIDKWIVDTYTIIENPEYTQEEMKKLSTLSKGNSVDDIFVSYNTFTEKYKNINLLVDLVDIKGAENIYWPTIKDRIKDLIKSTTMSEKMSLTINYDSDSGKLQIKDSKLYSISGLNDVELIDCSVSGDMSNVSLYYCHIVNVNASFCNFFTGCEISKSELNNCYISDGVTLDNSYIKGDSTIANGKLNNCTLAAGVKYTKYAKLKDCTNNAVKI